MLYETKTYRTETTVSSTTCINPLLDMGFIKPITHSDSLIKLLINTHLEIIIPYL